MPCVFQQTGILRRLKDENAVTVPSDLDRAGLRVAIGCGKKAPVEHGPGRWRASAFFIVEHVQPHEVAVDFD
jgi:hypothetical protein